MLSEKVLKQIIVITDGHSNYGRDPVDAAREAREYGITVNAVGILDAGWMGARGRQEVERIAHVGGGVCQFTAAEDIGQTIHTVTSQLTRRYSELILNRQLRQMTGVELTGLSPAQRDVLILLLMKLDEEIEMDLVLVLDTSGSMINKKLALEESLAETMICLGQRTGAVKLAIVQFPGPAGNGCLIKPWQINNVLTSRILRAVSYGGPTPTGPAIEAAVTLLLPDEAVVSRRTSFEVGTVV